MKENIVDNKENALPDDQIKNIPVDQIHGHREQDTGIRDKDKFQQLKESIKNIGLTNPLLLRPDNGGFELIAGHHRWIAVKELGWKEVPSKIKNVDANESAEMCLADNLLHSDYDPLKKEEKVYLRWINGKYPSKADLGRKIGLSDVWVNKLIEARELRIELQEEYPELKLDYFSPQTLIDAKKILDGKKIHPGNTDLVRLLEIANKKKWKQSKINQIVKDLNEWDSVWRKKVLYEDINHSAARLLMHDETSKPAPKSKKKTNIPVEKINKNYIIEIYKSIDEQLNNYISNIEDADEKAKSLRYLKVLTAFFGEVLQDNKEITDKQLKTLKEDILGIKISLHNYDGSEDLQRLRRFYDGLEESKNNSDKDSLQSPENKEEV
jgi:ParB/RepB/Spo0J family partition protein